MWTGADTVHAQALSLELDWLTALLNQRLEQHFQQTALQLPEPPALPADSELARLHGELALGLEERALLALALAPHLRPEALDLLFMRNQNLERGFTEFGGVKSQTHGGFLPTGETAAFLLAGGKTFHYIPALNDDPEWITARANITERHLAGWPTTATPDAQALAASREAALAQGATQ